MSITYLFQAYSNSSLPFINQRDFDQRLILDSNVDDLLFEGGVYCLNGKSFK